MIIQLAKNPYLIAISTLTLASTSLVMFQFEKDPLEQDSPKMVVSAPPYNSFSARSSSSENLPLLTPQVATSSHTSISTPTVITIEDPPHSVRQHIRQRIQNNGMGNWPAKIAVTLVFGAYCATMGYLASTIVYTHYIK